MIMKETRSAIEEEAEDESVRKEQLDAYLYEEAWMARTVSISKGNFDTKYSCLCLQAAKRKQAYDKRHIKAYSDTSFIDISCVCTSVQPPVLDYQQVLNALLHSQVSPYIFPRLRFHTVPAPWKPPKI